MHVESATVRVPSTHVDALEFLLETVTAMETKWMLSVCVVVPARQMRMRMAFATAKMRA